MRLPHPHAHDLWQKAVGSQAGSLTMLNRALAQERILLQSTNPETIRSFRHDHQLLPISDPYAWSAEVVDAVHRASRNIPGDTKLDYWNLSTRAAWWYLEEPVPLHGSMESIGLQAVGMAWVHSDSVVYPGDMEGDMFRISLWAPGVIDQEFWGTAMYPSHTWFWREGETIDTMMARVLGELEAEFGPGGPHEEQDHTPNDKIMESIAWFARFILAGLAWLEQKILESDDIRPEEHKKVAREFKAAAGRPLDAVKVIRLRKVEHHGAPLPEDATAEEKRHYTCRWTVDGHWRNARVGQGRTARRLTWVSPHLKGPEGMPLRVPKDKVFLVNR